jgi:hypothetical protein
MYLEIAPSGGKWWRFKYRFDGKERRISLGVYPDVGLAEARERRELVRKQVAACLDPGEQRRAEKVAHVERTENTLAAVARANGSLSPEVLTVLRRIASRGADETARRALQDCGRVFRYAVATARADRDPTRDLAGALAPRSVVHLPSITEPKAVGALMRAIDDYQGTFVTWADYLDKLKAEASHAKAV